MLRHPLLLTARDLLVLGLAFVVLCQVLNEPPTLAGFAVVVACAALYRSHPKREAEHPAPSNVVTFPRAAK